MLTSAECLKAFGDPSKEKSMIVWDVPQTLEKGKLPKRIYCNRAMVEPLHHVFDLIISRNLIHHVESWDGCFCIRNKRGGDSYSLHSWGLAVDINAASNKFGSKPAMSSELVKCFTDAGFDWGGTWAKPDGMHFQLRSL